MCRQTSCSKKRANSGAWLPPSKTFISITFYHVAQLHQSGFYSFINILGLALGLASCLLVFVYAKQEMSYDRFHPDAAQTFRFNLRFKVNKEVREGPLVSPQLVHALLLSKDFTRLVLFSFVLAVPLAYLTMGYWLSHFAYQVPWGVGLIAWLTVGYQSLKAALANPADSLKNE